jgi:hypothetical protein
MIKFGWKDGRIVILPQHLLVPQLRRIWEEDKDPEKQQATRELTYVFIMADTTEENPFSDRPYYELPGLALESAFRDKNYSMTEEKAYQLEAAIEAYLADNEFVDQRLVDTMNRKIEQVRKDLADNSISKENKDSQIDDMIKLDKICIARDNIKSRIVKQKEETLKLRGGVKESLLESGRVGKRLLKTLPPGDIPT